MGSSESSARPRPGSQASRALVIGVSGGIGSGKSTVSRLLEGLGGRRIDADLLAHRALRDPEVRARIHGRWGDSVFTRRGNVSRKALARMVFGDAKEAAALNRIIHPWVKKAILEQVALLGRRRGVRLIVLDAPLLAETGLDEICDRIVFVDASDRVRQGRLKSSRNWELAEMTRRENFQIPLNQKKRRADYTIDNNRTIPATLEQIKAIWREIAATEAPVN